MSVDGDLLFGHRWSREEDAKMRDFVEEELSQRGDVSWVYVSHLFGNKRTPTHCKNRWEQVINKGLAKGPWTKEEDDIIVRCKQQGMVRWKDVSRMVPNRIGKQCRERWDNHLNPDLTKAAWSEAEELQMIEAHSRLGNKWTKIAREMNGRSENDVKNHWHSLAFKKRFPELVSKKRKCEDSPEEMVVFNLSCDTHFTRGSDASVSSVEDVKGPSTSTHSSTEKMARSTTDVKCTSFEDYVENHGRSLASKNSSADSFLDLSRLSCGSPFELTPIEARRENSNTSSIGMTFWDLFTPNSDGSK